MVLYIHLRVVCLAMTGLALLLMGLLSSFPQRISAGRSAPSALLQLPADDRVSLRATMRNDAPPSHAQMPIDLDGTGTGTRTPGARIAAGMLHVQGDQQGESQRIIAVGDLHGSTRGLRGALRAAGLVDSKGEHEWQSKFSGYICPGTNKCIVYNFIYRREL